MQDVHFRLMAYDDLSLAKEIVTDVASCCEVPCQASAGVVATARRCIAGAAARWQHALPARSSF